MLVCNLISISGLFACYAFPDKTPKVPWPTLGWKNCLFAGSPSGARRAALKYSLIENCKLNGIELYAYLKDVLTRLPTIPIGNSTNCCPGTGKAPRWIHR